MISCVHYATEEENSQWNTGETKRGKTGTGMENGGTAAGELLAITGTAAPMLVQGGDCREQRACDATV
jgi:hypothetical protein